MSNNFKNFDNEELNQKVKDWWDKNPFIYLMDNKHFHPDWVFFRNVDRKIIKWMPWAQVGYPLLSSIIDYSQLANKKVLDIAVGSGWSTEQFVRSGALVTAIDLTPSAVELTKKRMEIYQLKAENIEVADAQNLSYPDNSFDYILAWGCLMHMPNTQRAINEIYRVLKPGGKIGAMMYNKNSLHWWYYIYLSKGIFRGKLLKMSIQELSNRYTDGVDCGGNQLTKFFTTNEIRKMFKKFKDVSIIIVDNFTFIDTFPHRFLPLGFFLPIKVKKWLSSKFGQTLWIEAIK